MSPEPAGRDAYGGRVEETWQDQWMSIQASGAELKEQAGALENLFGKIFDRFKEFSAGETWCQSGQPQEGDAQGGNSQDADNAQGDAQGGDAQRDGDGEDDAEMRDLKAAVEMDGRWVRGNKIGTWWATALKDDVELQIAFKNVGKSYPDQRAFKAKWAVMRFEEKKETKKRIERSETTDILDAAYTCGTKIWIDEGGDAQGLVAAKNYIDSCVEKMKNGETLQGRPWIRFNKMTKRFDFLYAKQGFQARQTDAWEMSTEYGTAAPSQATTPTSEGTLPKGKGESKANPKGKEKPKAEPKGKRKKGAGGEQDEETAVDTVKEMEKKRKKDLITQYGTAQAVKQRMTAALMSATDVIGLIRTDTEGWGWASSPRNIDPVLAAKNTVDTIKHSSPFMKVWLLQDNLASYAKQTFKDADIQVGFSRLDGFVKEIQALEETVALLKRRHEA